MFKQFCFVPASLCLVLAVGCSSTLASNNPGSGGGTTTNGPYSGFTKSYTIPFTNSPNFGNLTSTLKVQAQINGGTLSSYTVDTGSVGVVVPASEVPNIPANSPSGSLTYSSSGLQLNGVWATMPMTFPNAASSSGGTTTVTAKVPVLAVTSSSCTGSGVNSGNCTGTVPHMLGVGFGRDTTVQTSPVYNPFLNTSEMAAGTMRHGYIIARNGLTLGLTDSNATSTGFVIQTLTSAGTPASGTHNDWNTPVGGFKVGTGTAVTGTALLDTGLLNMIIENSSSPQSGTVSTGTAMTITLGTQNYSFTTGDGTAQAPTSVSWANASHGTFINTGLRALGHYDLLFDADNGYFGLRPE